MDVFDNTLDTHVFTNGVEYTGKVNIAGNGDFSAVLNPTNTESVLGNYVTRLSGDISQSGLDDTSYVLNYFLEQGTDYPHPNFEFVDGVATSSPIDDNGIVFVDRVRNVKISLHDPQVTEQEETQLVSNIDNIPPVNIPPVNTTSEIDVENIAEAAAQSSTEESNVSDDVETA